MDDNRNMLKNTAGLSDRYKTEPNKYTYAVILMVIIMLQFIAAFYFCTKKEGFHYDEYYSYYSSNVSYGLIPTDNEWMDTSEISDEFKVLRGQGFNYGMVKLMQTYDVHPPLYYYILHTVCSLTPGVFSKWQGLTVNLIFWLLSFPVLIGICNEILCKQYNKPHLRILGEKDDNRHYKLCQLLTAFIIFLYGFSPAVLSGVMFIRMYVLLTFICLLTIYFNLRIIGYVENIRSDRTDALLKGAEADNERKRRWNTLLCGIGIIAMTFIGTQVHYYYIVFLFFTAAYMTLYMLISPSGNTSREKVGSTVGDKPVYHADIRNALGYAAAIITGLIASVIYYPSMLRHIFRGYRGTEATAAFFDMGNLRERAGLFVGLLNEYLIYDFFYLLILEVLMFYLYQRYRRSRGKRQDEGRFFDHRIGLIGFVTAGDFLVVLKTALLNAEEAVRYEMPVYGLIILLIVLGIGINLKGISNPDDKKGSKISAEQLILCIIMISACFVQIYGLYRGKVLFLYEEDAKFREWAAEHEDDTIVYIYNPDNQWMIWDDAAELMQYDRIFFISADNKDEISDSDIATADRIYVYSARSDEAMERLKNMLELGGEERTLSIIRQLKYADLYELEHIE